MIDTIILTIIFGWIVLWLNHKLKTQVKNLPPGPLRIPGIGNIIQIAQAKSKLFHIVIEKISEKYGNIVYLEIGLNKGVAIMGPEYVKKAIQEENFLFRPKSRIISGRTCGKDLGVFFSSGEVWRESRKYIEICLKDFGCGQKQSFEVGFIQEYGYFTEMLQNKLKNTDGLISTEGLFEPFFTNFLWKAVTGSRFDYEDPKLKNMLNYSRYWLEMADSGARILTAYPFLGDWFPGLTGWTKLREIVTQWQNCCINLVEEVKSKQNYLTKPESLLDTFLLELHKKEHDEEYKIKHENDEFFTHENLISTLMDMFLAGADTSTGLTNFSVLYMIKYPDVQEKVRSEIDDVLGRERWPNMEDRKNMTYTNAVILELLRIANIIPIIPRRASVDTKFEDYIIPEGADVYVSTYSVHMDEKLWGDPHNFRPSRFLSPNGTIVNTENLIPFGAGKKNCLGESHVMFNMFMFFTRLIQQYTFQGDPTNHGAVNTDSKPGLTQCPYPCNIVIKQRN